MVELEKRFKTAWRQGEKIRSRFRTRQKIVAWMEAVSKEKQISVNDVAKLADERLKESPDKVARRLRRKENVTLALA